MSKAKPPEKASTDALASAIDKAVNAMLERTEARDDKGAYIVGAKEIDAAVKWYAVKHKVDDGGGMGSKLPRLED